MRFTNSIGVPKARNFAAHVAHVDNSPIAYHSQRRNEARRDNASRVAKQSLIVIGAGPVGQSLAEQLVRNETFSDIKIFGDEPYQPYNRVKLTSLLAGSVALSDLLNPLYSENSQTSLKYINSRISEIDPKTRSIRDEQGHRYSYDRLVLATGSQPLLPSIPGIGLPGVNTLRTLRDVETLCARRSRARHIVVVGGGLLGLEAAYALSRSSTEVTLVQRNDRLMNRQLDHAAAIELQRRIESKGIRLILNQSVRLVKGTDRVEGITTRFGECVLCDTVLFCTGSRPNVELARRAEIRIRRGILVDDHLQTSIDGIFAIGECSEHRRRVYGLVAPGMEQATVLANRFYGGKARYSGSQSVSRLKVVDEEVTSIGAVFEGVHQSGGTDLVYTCKASGDYRKLVLEHGHLIGACGIGPWPESTSIEEAVQNRRYIHPWQRWKFRYTGIL